MRFDWTDYDRYFTDKPRQQTPMALIQKQALEQRTIRLLDLNGGDSGNPVGFCSPPGVFSFTVVRVPAGVPHRFSKDYPGVDIGLKFIKKGPGPSPQSIVDFHRDQRPRVPGLPHPLVQNVYEAGVDADGMHYVVQEWIHGDTLESRLISGIPLTPEEARSFVEDYFIETLLPLWSAGCVFWDHRPANLVISERDGRKRVVMIDTDTLAACAKEIVETPRHFAHRDRIKVSRALARIRTMITTIHESFLEGLNLPRKEVSARRKALKTAISGVTDVLGLPGLPANDPRIFDGVVRCFQ